MAHKIIIDGVIGWEVFARDIRTELQKAKGQDVEIEISSPGGQVSEGLTIYNLIKAYSGKTTSIINGLAASMASYIALASDKVSATDNAIYMIHNASRPIIGDHNDLRRAANILEKMTGKLSKVYALKTGKSSEEVLKMMNEETFLFGDEIVSNGFADSIIDSDSQDSQEDAEAYAKISIVDCQAKLKEQNNQDWDQVAALLKSTAPKAKIKTKQEEEMTPEEIQALQEKLAKAETALAEAKAKEVEAKVEEPVAEVEEPKTPSDNAMDILASASYPDSVKAVAKKVLKGEQTQENLDAIVAMADMIAESKNSEAAQEESGEIGETPAHQQPVSNLVDGKAVNMAGIKEIAAKLKNAQTNSEDK